MFDIGFAELVLIAVIGLLVIGPERLPETIRTASLWLGRIKRGYNEVKQEIQQELHNDAVLQELRKSGEDLKEQADALGRDINEVTENLIAPEPNRTGPDKPGPGEPDTRTPEQPGS